MIDQDFDYLLNLVASMREAQKDYFKVRTSGALEVSKALERRVDAVVAEYKAAQQDQPKLFEIVD